MDVFLHFTHTVRICVGTLPHTHTYFGLFPRVTFVFSPSLFVVDLLGTAEWTNRFGPPHCVDHLRHLLIYLQPQWIYSNHTHSWTCPTPGPHGQWSSSLADLAGYTRLPTHLPSDRYPSCSCITCVTFDILQLNPSPAPNPHCVRHTDPSWPYIQFPALPPRLTAGLLVFEPGPPRTVDYSALRMDVGLPTYGPIWCPTLPPAVCL